MLVGVDPLGFDVRRRFDVIRIQVPAPMETIEAVEECFARMAGEAG